MNQTTAFGSPSAIEQVINSLSLDEWRLLERLTVYETAVISAGIICISKDLQHTMQLLDKLISLSLVQVEVNDEQEKLYQINPFIAEWLNNRKKLNFDVIYAAARHQLWYFENRDYSTYSQILVVYRALVFSEMQRDIENFIVKHILPERIQAGMYEQILQEWLPIIQISPSSFIKPKVLYYEGLVHFNLGHLEKALICYEKAYSLYNECKIYHYEEIILTLTQVANVYTAKSEYEKALKHAMQSLYIVQEKEDALKVSITLKTISDIYYAKKNFDLALDYLQQSNSVAKRYHLYVQEGNSLENIANFYCNQTKYEDAFKYFIQALEIFQKEEEHASSSRVLGSLGNIYSNIGHDDIALNYLKQALISVQKTANKRSEVLLLIDIARLYLALNQDEEALKYSKQAQVIAENIDDSEQLTKITTYLNKIKRNKEARESSYATFFDEFELEDIYQSVEDANKMCKSLIQEGKAYLAKKERLKGLSTLVRAYLLAKKIAEQTHQTNHLEILKRIAVQQGGDAKIEFWENLSRQNPIDIDSLPKEIMIVSTMFSSITIILLGIAIFILVFFSK
ncbi:tetratricopeptide repeat protein [Candidatus Albibeggiatoa sp. nov. NOAA]|uniref:tetratricopeptide repeat protein n=1 Tax=Candidatus Albibeggiatoa sp. nov. NOAA TaxID=3162724 RepID=UPI0032F45690|nr:tetratricopeptide repeat protein [Thiotrichaceae bacterium]